MPGIPFANQVVTQAARNELTLTTPLLFTSKKDAAVIPIYRKKICCISENNKVAGFAVQQ